MPKQTRSLPSLSQDVFVVLREEDSPAAGPPTIRIQKVVGTQYEAREEIKRLTLANRSKGRRYFWQPTRMDGIGEIREKIEKYEGLLHDVQMYAEVVLRGDKVHELILNICRWSYAHRVGNGEISEEEQDRIIRKAFDKLREVKKDELHK